MEYSISVGAQIMFMLLGFAVLGALVKIMFKIL